MAINYVGKPDNLDLPFFAYGIFKPGQIAYYRIKKYLRENPIETIVDYEMKYRDGVPILCGEKNDIFQTKGYLIKFDNPQAAYSRIGTAEVDELYQWKIIDVNGEDAYALVGKDMPNGCFDNRDYTLSNYDYRCDSFFTYARKLIKSCNEEYKQKEHIGMEDFFILQMHYMLLWSVIERFCHFKYGYSLIGFNKFKLAKEPVFKNSLKNVERCDTIYSSDKLEEYELDPYDYEKSIGYYYTIRCNVVHRGKTVDEEDMVKLKLSFNELLGLFESVYKDTLNQSNQVHAQF